MAAAIKLTKSELEKVEKLQSTLEEAAQNLETAVNEYNDQLAKLNATVSESLEAYKRSVTKVTEFTERVVDRLSNAIDDRTEDWQDSDEGIASIELRDAWKEYHETAQEFTEPSLDLIEEIEAPELLSETMSLYDLPQDAND